MVKCVNAECKNHGHELDMDMKICPICGMETEKSKSKSNANLGVIAVIAAIVSIVFFVSAYDWFGYTLTVVSLAASIVLSFISKRKAAIVIAFLFLAGIFGLIVFNTL